MWSLKFYRENMKEKRFLLVVLMSDRYDPGIWVFSLRCFVKAEFLSYQEPLAAIFNKRNLAPNLWQRGGWINRNR